MSEEEFQGRVLAALAALRGDMDAMRADMGTMQASIGTMQANVAAIQADMDAVRGEIRRTYAVLDRTEIKVDKLVRDKGSLLPRMTAMEMGAAQGMIADATIQTRLDDHDTRLALVERRLELRDK